MRSNVSSVPVPLDDKYSWQILRGKDGTHATAWALRAAQVGHILQDRQLVDQTQTEMQMRYMISLTKQVWQLEL